MIGLVTSAIVASSISSHRRRDNVRYSVNEARQVISTVIVMKVDTLWVTTKTAATMAESMRYKAAMFREVSRVIIAVSNEIIRPTRNAVKACSVSTDDPSFMDRTNMAMIAAIGLD